MEFVILKTLKSKPKFKFSFNENRSVTKKKIIKPTKEAITIKTKIKLIHKKACKWMK